MKGNTIKMKKLNKYFLIAALCVSPFSMFSQNTDEPKKPSDAKEDLGDETYIIVKDYRPILAESAKISDSPEGDTSSTNPPEMKYSIRSQKAETSYETSTIKAVKIKDEPLTKLYRSYIKLGLGNYSIYNGELYVNALRSKTGSLGLALGHHSGSPGLKGVGPAAYSKNHGGVYGKYMLDNKTFAGEFNFDRNAVHYYGYNSEDSILDKSQIAQRFNIFGLKLNFATNYLKRDKIDYSAGIDWNSVNDKYEVNESDVRVHGFVGKDMESFYLKTDLSFDYFKKSRANYELFSSNTDLSRHIINVVPMIQLKNEKARLNLGVDLALEKNLESEIHLFPKVDFSLPIAENIFYLFANVSGGVVKNNFLTMALENPFVNSTVQPMNTINKIELKGGMNGSFSSRVSFLAFVKYSSFDRLQLYYNDSISSNKFNTLYTNGKVLNIHGELTYRAGEKFEASVHIDQYKYSLDFSQKAWHHPNTEVKFSAKYNLRDKLYIDGALFGRGSYYVRIQELNGFSEKSIKGYVDGNLGLEYRYSKILSVFANFNNLGFARYYYWNDYPSERFNMLAGITYSF